MLNVMMRWRVLTAIAIACGMAMAGDVQDRRDTALPKTIPSTRQDESTQSEDAIGEPSPQPTSDESITLSLETGQRCFVGETQLVVDIIMRQADEAIIGGQFFLAYDTDRLSVQEVVSGDSPFTLLVYQDTSVPGEIDCATGAAFGQPGTSADTRMASIVFDILDAAVLEPALVRFRPHEPTTRVTNDSGASIEPALIDLPAISLQADPADVDGDGVPFDCDACPNTIPGIQVDELGCPPRIRGDDDRDGDVDDADVDHFALCKGQPTVPAPATCQDRDFDVDGDVDQTDFAALQQCYSGENVPAPAACHLE